jgi:PST family polysaccharide transporter
MASARPRDVPPEHLAGKAVSGTGWTALSIVGQRGLSLLSTMVLARLLAPSAYGLLGMAVVFLAVANTFRDLGTSSALVQRKESSNDITSTLFWINALLGLTGFLVLVALAPVAALMYREPRVTPVLAVLAMSFLISHLSAVHHATLMRAMAFRRLTLIQLTAAIAATLCGIGLALGGAGVWSLVWALLVESTTGTLLLWMMVSWRPAWHLRLADLRQVSSFSLNLVGSRLLLYVIRNVDKALVGRYLGAVTLGYYSLAHGLMMYPLHNISWALVQVLLPAFSRIQDDGERFGRAYLRTIAVISTLSFPLMLGMLITSDLLVLVCFGAQWEPMAPILVILAPAGMVQSASTTTSVVFTAKGRTDWMFRLVLAETVLAVTAYAVGMHWGIVGLATSYSLAHLVWSFPLFMFGARLSGLAVSEVYRALWPALRDSLLMGAVVEAVRLGLEWAGVSTPWLLLGAMVSVGILLYLALLLRARPPFLQDLVETTPLGQFAWARRLGALSRA